MQCSVRTRASHSGPHAPFGFFFNCETQTEPKHIAGVLQECHVFWRFGPMDDWVCYKTPFRQHQLSVLLAFGRILFILSFSRIYDQRPKEFYEDVFSSTRPSTKLFGFLVGLIVRETKPNKWANRRKMSTLDRRNRADTVWAVVGFLYRGDDDMVVCGVCVEPAAAY